MPSCDEINPTALAKVALATLFACALCFACAFSCPKHAFAADSKALSERVTALETDIQNLKSEREELETQLVSIVSSLDEVEDSIETNRIQQSSFRESGYKAMVSLYKIENTPFMLLDSVLEAESLNDAFKRVDYFEKLRSFCEGRVEQIQSELEALSLRRNMLKAQQTSIENNVADRSNRIENAESELKGVREQLEKAKDPGRRIAAAAVALAGCSVKGNSAPGPSNYAINGKTAKNPKIAPPRSSSKGDWSVYLDVYNKISNGNNVPNHACCDCLVALAVLWSDADDNFLNGKYPTEASMRNYLNNSSKWDRVGGSNGYWYKNSSKGVELQPGDILFVDHPERNSRHWMIYVGHDIAANKWGANTIVDCVDEAHSTRWANGKPLSCRSEEKWVVYRRNTNDYNPDTSKWASFMTAEKERYL